MRRIIRGSWRHQGQGLNECLIHGSISEDPDEIEYSGHACGSKKSHLWQHSRPCWRQGPKRACHALWCATSTCCDPSSVRICDKVQVHGHSASSGFEGRPQRGDGRQCCGSSRGGLAFEAEETIWAYGGSHSDGRIIRLFMHVPTDGGVLKILKFLRQRVGCHFGSKGLVSTTRRAYNRVPRSCPSLDSKTSASSMDSTVNGSVSPGHGFPRVRDRVTHGSLCFARSPLIRAAAKHSVPRHVGQALKLYEAPCGELLLMKSFPFKLGSMRCTAIVNNLGGGGGLT